MLGKRMGYVQNINNGRPVENADVQVQIYGTDTAATIYSDEDGTEEADNPRLTDEVGYYEYFAENGRYTEVITTNDDERTLSDILIEAPPLRAELDFDPSNLADGAGESTTVTVTGAELGDEATVAFSNSTQGMLLMANVTAADTVTVRFQNETGGAINLGAGTLYVTVRKLTG